MKRIDIGENYEPFRVIALVPETEEKNEPPGPPKVYVYLASKIELNFDEKIDMGTVIPRDSVSLSEFKNQIERLKNNLDILYKKVRKKKIFDI